MVLHVVAELTSAHQLQYELSSGLVGRPGEGPSRAFRMGPAATAEMRPLASTSVDAVENILSSWTNAWGK